MPDLPSPRIDPTPPDTQTRPSLYCAATDQGGMKLIVAPSFADAAQRAMTWADALDEALVSIVRTGVSP